MNLKVAVELALGNHQFTYNAMVDNAITGIYGPSGAGKTTLLNIIAGTLTPGNGRIAFNDTLLFDSTTGANIPGNRRRMGVVFQDNYLFPHMTVKQNLLYSKPYLKNDRIYADLNTVVSLLDIKTLLDKKPVQLSGGERQRVAIGRALLSQPRLLLLDEPFSSLDRQRRRRIISYLLQINRQFSIPLLIVSHDLEDILKLTRSLLIIEAGRVTASGDYLEIAESGAAPEIISHRRYLNITDLHYVDSRDSLCRFAAQQAPDSHLIVNADDVPPDLKPGQLVRFSIRPDDIALSAHKVPQISIQNHLLGTITHMHDCKKSCFVTVDCGFPLIAQVTRTAVQNLGLQSGSTVWCLIKAKAVEVVHTFTS